MGMLSYMSEVSRKNRIRNDYIRESLGVVDIRDKMREHRPLWLGHVMTRDEENLVRSILGFRVESRRSRGRPKRDLGAGDTGRYDCLLDREDPTSR